MNAPRTEGALAPRKGGQPQLTLDGEPRRVDILHKVGIQSSSLEDAYRALTTIEGLSGWWTENTQGESKVGGVIRFRFGAGGIDMKVLELHPAQRVLWEVVDGPEEWIGTKVSWELRQEGDWTIVLFKHQGWKEPVEFMHHCSTKWGVFLLSLKSLLETGKGAPAPNDIKLDSWE
jgi:Activator of Hsp90 ATPase homolog 1-like protein